MEKPIEGLAHGLACSPLQRNVRPSQQILFEIDDHGHLANWHGGWFKDDGRSFGVGSWHHGIDMTSFEADSHPAIDSCPGTCASHGCLVLGP
jgi:hypothetical protein